MKMQGETRIAAPPETVWAALNDPETLKKAIPGCEELVQSEENEFTATVAIKVGPIKARFSGKVALSDMNPPHSYRINGEGQGGLAGFASGGAFVSLKEDGPEHTILTYDVDASIGGKIAQLGSRLIESTARKLADKFFVEFGNIITDDGSEETTSSEQMTGTGAHANQSRQRSGSFWERLFGTGLRKKEVWRVTSEQGVHVTIEQSLAIVTINQPDKRNAVTLSMWRDLKAVLNRLGKNPDVRAVILAGNGDDFCVGADISEFGEVRSNKTQTAAYEKAVDESNDAISDCPKPVIAAIRGYCIGGGCGLAMACDFRIAEPDATLFIPSAKMSIVYGMRETQNLLELVGLPNAKRILFSADRLKAHEALEIGLVDTISDSAIHGARNLAEKLSENAPLAIKGSKAILNGLSSGNGGLDHDLAHQLIAEASESEDYREGQKAFAERRSPRFVGA